MKASEIQKDRKILKILCKDIYNLVNEIVQRHSEKQVEKTIVAQEELFARSLYRDCFDSDLSSDFSLLYAEDWHVINIIQNIKPSSKASFCSAIEQIIEFVKREDHKQQLSQVAKKYKKDENKFEWIFTQAIKKVYTYT